MSEEDKLIRQMNTSSQNMNFLLENYEEIFANFVAGEELSEADNLIIQSYISFSLAFHLASKDIWK